MLCYDGKILYDLEFFKKNFYEENLVENSYRKIKKLIEFSMIIFS